MLRFDLDGFVSGAGALELPISDDSEYIVEVHDEFGRTGDPRVVDEVRLLIAPWQRRAVGAAVALQDWGFFFTFFKHSLVRRTFFMVLFHLNLQLLT